MPYDPKSPLTQILQTKSWPLEYKPQNLPRYDGSVDPRQFIMSYEAEVAVAGGGEYTMVNSFVTIAWDIAQSWYNNLPLGSIDSWGSLHENNATTSKVLALRSTTLWNYSLALNPKENPSETSGEGSFSS
jgi:hypothetical protein